MTLYLTSDTHKLRETINIVFESYIVSTGGYRDGDKFIFEVWIEYES